MITSMNFHNKTMSNEQMRPNLYLFSQNYAFVSAHTPCVFVLVKLKNVPKTDVILCCLICISVIFFTS